MHIYIYMSIYVYICLYMYIYNIYIYIYIYTRELQQCRMSTKNFPTSLGRGRSQGSCCLYVL